MTGAETDASTTATALAAALTTAFPVGGGNPTFAAVGPVITAVPDTLSVSIGWNSIDDDGVPHTSIVDTTSEDLVDVINTATTVDNDYHFLLAESRESADVVKLADYATANDKQYFTSTGDSEVADNADVDNIAITLGDKAQDNVALMYLTTDKFYFPESTLVGGMAAIEPYVLFNPNFMTLSGIPVDYLTETQIVTLTQRNTSFYIKERGYNVYKSGWTMGGNFVDTIRNATWAKVRIEEVLTALLKEKADLGSALPYTDAGAAQMESRVRTQVINVGIRGGSIAEGSTTDPELGTVINLDPVVNFGTRAQQTNANIASRVWADAQVEYVYVSGINNIKVNLNVLLNRDPE
ncbi:putative tail sheath protein [Vibrio phage VPMCC14]|nr:putative tail sheath protein [Vibrio phage VPMCC14]